MSTQDNPEVRALEALIVSRLRPQCAEQVDSTKLPSLSEQEKSSLTCLRPGFIQAMIEKTANQEAEEEDLEEATHSHEVGNRELVHGMNRADKIDDVTEEELRKKRQEMQEKMREEDNGGRDRKGG